MATSEGCESVRAAVTSVLEEDRVFTLNAELAHFLRMREREMLYQRAEL